MAVRRACFSFRGGSRLVSYVYAATEQLDLRVRIGSVLAGMELLSGEEASLTFSYLTDRDGSGFITFTKADTDTVLTVPDVPRTEITDVKGLIAAAEDIAAGILRPMLGM